MAPAAGPLGHGGPQKGLFAGGEGVYEGTTPATFDYVTAILKGKPGNYALKVGNSQSGNLKAILEGRLRRASRFTEGYFLPHAAAIKQSVRIPVIAVGGLRQKATMERLLERGEADLVALSRPFIRQPNLVSRMERDPRVTSATCVSCNRCTVEVTLRYRPLRCYLEHIRANGEQAHGNHRFPAARKRES